MELKDLLLISLIFPNLLVWPAHRLSKHYTPTRTGMALKTIFVVQLLFIVALFFLLATKAPHEGDALGAILLLVYLGPLFLLASLITAVVSDVYKLLRHSQ